MTRIEFWLAVMGSSPRTYVPCGAETPCEPGYWAFRAPDCEYHGVPHPPGSLVLLESETRLQCRCRLVLLLTNAGRATQSCKVNVPVDRSGQGGTRALRKEQRR